MTRKSQTRQRPAGDVRRRITIIQADKEIRKDSEFTTLLKSATQEILTLTCWFDPPLHQKPSPVTVRFSGHRVNVKGRPLPGDRFVQDEIIEEVVPRSGPISLTARVRDINPGEWMVTVRMQGNMFSATGFREREDKISATGSPGLIARFWRRWAPNASSDEPVRTCLIPFARVPGIFPGIWGIMVTLGMAIALAFQSWVIAVDHLVISSAWVISLLAIGVGIVGAKGWYLVLYRHEHLVNGWCIQGFIVGATLAAAILLVRLDVPAGTFLDVTAPGLLIAMAIGRVGCFFAGCCGGPPTASRFGVWSSDQRVGARRIPTQLMEMLLALSLGLLVLVTILGHGPAGGAYFAGALAAYTLVRQGILYLRAEPRKTKLGLPITAALATFVLITAVVFLIR